eukprot:Ihof_evm1s611 gene=Ihof_evmTU1s611
MFNENDENNFAIPVADLHNSIVELPTVTEPPQVDPVSPPVTKEEDSPDTTSEEKQKSVLINQVLELQNTLDELSQRVNRVKDENAKLKGENQVLSQYIENLMASSNGAQGARESV